MAALRMPRPVTLASLIVDRILPAMPSIEIVAVGQSTPIETRAFPFAVLADAKLVSHRSPSPRFQADFNRTSGIIYHLGNPNLKTDTGGRCFFASQLLSEESKNAAEFLAFDSPFRSAVEVMMAELIANSPTSELIFTSDWQYGPEWTRREPPLSLTEFWRLHDSRQVLLNALYPIKAG